ncbi:MAG TPA: DUF3870 domain-containing protein [Thermoleophilia bacterium]|nr:DUF3870 domain-containing protein [Thermoleophilia bacterium]
MAAVRASATLCAVKSFLFSGYARLPQDVSHQALYERVGVAVEVDSRGRVIHCSSTLIMDLSRDFLARLLAGRSMITERDEIEAELRLRYRGHSQGALIFALRKIYEAVDQSPLVARVGAVAPTSAGLGPASSSLPESPEERTAP